MGEIIFLIVLALIWISAASIQDLKKREVANWISFSLIVFALGIRFFYSLFINDFNFFYYGLMGLGVFLIIGNVFYYGRIFAGGDAKLMIALGTVLPFSENFLTNVKIVILFFFIFLFVGGLYGLIISVVLSLKNFKNFKKEFSRQLKKNKKRVYILMFIGLLFMALGFINSIFFIPGIFIFISSYFYAYAKAVDEVCMIKNIRTNKLTEGDWLYKNIKIGKKFIKANWEGLGRKDIESIKKKYKSIQIRQGIPFVPVFFISFVILLYLFYSGYFEKWINLFWVFG